MRIIELDIRKNISELELYWKVSEGEQTSYEVFLIRRGSVAEMKKAACTSAGCSFCTPVEPLREYTILLTVGGSGSFVTARAEFFADKSAQQYQKTVYIK